MKVLGTGFLQTVLKLWDPRFRGYSLLLDIWSVLTPAAKAMVLDASCCRSDGVFNLVGIASTAIFFRLGRSSIDDRSEPLSGYL